MSDTIVKVCLDRWLPEEEPFNRPPVNEHGKAAIETVKMWEPGRTLHISFLGGDTVVQDKVKAHANEWLKHANIKFDFDLHTNPEIRVAFIPGGSWSQIGKDALGVLNPLPTMNLGWLTKDTEDEEYARVVLHEFGHALGLIHEHNSPGAQIHWNKPAVYDYYMGPPNKWDKAKVDRNLFEVYDAKQTQFSAFDQKSIMVYPIPKEHTLDGFTVDWNRTLSPTDIEFIGQWYPFPKQQS